jgi:hypothetical protein
MMTSLISIVVVAALFALFGLLKPRPGCGPHCSVCKSPCEHAAGGKDV